MKKYIIYISLIFIVIISFIVYKYQVSVTEKNSLIEANKQYEKYYNNIVNGTEVASLINKVIDNNEKNQIVKNENNEYISNDKDSINIDVKFKDSDKIFNIEKIYNLGIDQFIYNYNSMNFKCTKMEYHQNSNRIKYMYFEEI